MYNDYLEHGFQYVREKHGYTKTRENLTQAFKKHLPEYDKHALLKATLKVKAKDGSKEQLLVHRNMSIEAKVKYYSEMYAFFKNHTFEETKERYDVVCSRNSLLFNFKRYVKEYVPTPTPRWSKKVMSLT